MDFGNQYSYFQTYTDDRFQKPLFDKLDLTILVYLYHLHDKVTGMPIIEVFSLVG